VLCSLHSSDILRGYLQGHKGEVRTTIQTEREELQNRASRECCTGQACLWPPSFKGAIFDFDGTISLTHDVWTEVDRVFLGARGIEVTPDYQRALSALGFEAGARYTIERYNLHETVEDICDEWYRMGRALYESRVTLRPGVETYIRALQSRGIPCALATVNDPEVLFVCHHIDVRGLFDVLVFSKEVNKPKDSPDIYLEAARRLGVAATQCIVFEDLAIGLRSAHSAGMQTCAVNSCDDVQDIAEVQGSADLWLADWQDIPLG